MAPCSLSQTPTDISEERIPASLLATLTCSSTQMTGAVRSTETHVNFYHATQHYVPGDAFLNI
jgi:hypothetical protein